MRSESYVTRFFTKRTANNEVRGLLYIEFPDVITQHLESGFKSHASYLLREAPRGFYRTELLEIFRQPRSPQRV